MLQKKGREITNNGIYRTTTIWGIISDFEGQSKKLLGFVFLLRLRLFCCYEEVQTAPRFKKKIDIDGIFPSPNSQIKSDWNSIRRLLGFASYRNRVTNGNEDEMRNSSRCVLFPLPRRVLLFFFIKRLRLVSAL